MRKALVATIALLSNLIKGSGEQHRCYQMGHLCRLKMLYILSSIEGTFIALKIYVSMDIIYRQWIRRKKNIFMLPKLFHAKNLYLKAFSVYLQDYILQVLK